MTRGDEKPPSTPASVLHPFKPWPVLFFTLLALTLLWIGALVAMYVTTQRT